jgi:glycosyltransferase involved in cell wall biosynthesis
MKVLHICSYYTTVSLFKDMFGAQLEAGIGLRAFVPADRRAENAAPADEFVDIRPCFSKWDRLLFGRKQRKIYAALKKTYDFSQFGLVHAHTLFSNGYAAYRLKKEYGLPYVAAVRATDIDFFFKKLVWLRRLGRKILENAAAVVFISPQGKNALLSKYIPKAMLPSLEPKCAVLPNGLASFWLENKSENTRSIADGEEVRILTVGKTAPEKNLAGSIAACNALRRRGYSVAHTIIGKVTDKKIAGRIKKDPSVTFFEEMGNQALLAHMRQSHIFFLPSLRETFGRVYAEALTQGLPVIYTRGQGFDGFFAEGTVGHAADAGDPEDMADKLEDIIKNYDTFRDACNALPDLFVWGELAARYKALYQSVLDGAPIPAPRPGSS